MSSRNRDQSPDSLCTICNVKRAKKDGICKLCERDINVLVYCKRCKKRVEVDCSVIKTQAMLADEDTDSYIVVKCDVEHCIASAVGSKAAAVGICERETEEPLSYYRVSKINETRASKAK